VFAPIKYRKKFLRIKAVGKFLERFQDKHALGLDPGVDPVIQPAGVRQKNQ